MGTRKAFFLDPYNTDIVKEIALLGRAYDSNDSNVIDFLNKAKTLSREDYLKMKKDWINYQQQCTKTVYLEKNLS